MVKIIECNTIIPAAPGTYATVFDLFFDDEEIGKVVESHPLVVGWLIHEDNRSQQALPVFATRRAPVIKDNSDEIIFLQDHDGKLIGLNCGHRTFDTVEQARAYAVRVLDPPASDTHTAWNREGWHTLF